MFSLQVSTAVRSPGAHQLTYWEKGCVMLLWSMYVMSFNNQYLEPIHTIGSTMHNYSYREHIVYIESGLCLHIYFSPFTHPCVAIHWLGLAHVFVHGQFLRVDTFLCMRPPVAVAGVTSQCRPGGRLCPNPLCPGPGARCWASVQVHASFLDSDNHRVWGHWTVTVHNVPLLATWDIAWKDRKG